MLLLWTKNITIQIKRPNIVRVRRKTQQQEMNETLDAMSALIMTGNGKYQKKDEKVKQNRQTICFFEVDA